MDKEIVLLLLSMVLISCNGFTSTPAISPTNVAETTLSIVGPAIAGNSFDRKIWMA
jgi:hypothetical protein